MLLKLLAPLRTDFAIVSERPLQQPEQYARFWDNVYGRLQKLRPRLVNLRQLSPELHEVRFAHRTIHHPMLGSGSQYRTLANDSLARPLHVLEIHLTAAQIDLTPEENACQQLLEHLDRVVIRVYDHHIALIEADLAMGQQLQELADESVGMHLQQLEQTASLLGEELSHWCREQMLQPLFAWLGNQSDADHYIDITPSRMVGERVMWVTRTLIFETDDERNRDEIIHHWLINSGGTEEIDGKSRIEHLQADADGHLTLWLNYLFRESAYPPRQPAVDAADALMPPFCDDWKALIYAQYYYAALDVVDSHLTTILASAWGPDQDVKIESLKQLLEYNIRNANLLLIQHHDNAKYYRRAVKNELDTILSYWEFEYVLVEPVQHKITLCESRLQLLLQQEAAKSAIFTDMILLGIGITGIFSTFLGLAEFGRTMATDVDLASYDVNSPNLIEWLAVQPTDVILVLSLMLSAVLAILYLFFRQRQTVS